MTVIQHFFFVLWILMKGVGHFNKVSLDDVYTLPSVSASSLLI